MGGGRPVARVAPMDERDQASRRGIPDAPAIRSELDEAAASRARAHYRREGMAALETDTGIAPLLEPGERIFATHRPARIRHRISPAGAGDPPAAEGDLYLTSARLVLVGPTVIAVDLEEIEEAVLAGDTLLLVLRHGVGLALAVERPHLLRVQIAAARSVARGPVGRLTGGTGR